jgi:hypothetical protein
VVVENRFLMLDLEDVTRTGVSKRKKPDDGEPAAPCYMFWSGYDTPFRRTTDVLGQWVVVRIVDRQLSSYPVVPSGVTLPSSLCRTQSFSAATHIVIVLSRPTMEADGRDFDLAERGRDEERWSGAGRGR